MKTARPNPHHPCRQPDPSRGAAGDHARQAGRASLRSAAYEACLKESVADVVRRQAEVGLDVISDGEYGKAISWNQYVVERLSGFELRAIPPGSGPGFPAPTARASRNSTPSSTCASRWPTTGWSPASARSNTSDRRSSSAISTISKPRSRASRWRRPSCRWWRLRACCRIARTSTTGAKRNGCRRSPMRCARNTG